MNAPTDPAPAFETPRRRAEEASRMPNVAGLSTGPLVRDLNEVGALLLAALDENERLREALQRIARGDFPKMVTGDLDPLADAGDFAAKSLKGGGG